MRSLSEAGDAASKSVTGCPRFDYAVGQPNLYRMMRFKQDLVVRHGLANGFDIYARTFRFTRHAVLSPVDLESERTFAEQRHLCFEETARAGESFVHQPPVVLGDGNHRVVRGVTRSQYVACLPDARIRGRCAVTAVDGHWLLDVQGDEPSRLDDEIDWDPVVFHGDWPRPWGIAPRDDAGALCLREAFNLMGGHTDFFGHWLWEYLPKYAAARQSGALPDVPVLIDAHMPSSHRESLEVLYRPASVIEVPAFTPVHVERLWCAPTLSYVPLHEVRNDRFSWDAVSSCPARFEPIVSDLKRRFDSLHTRSTFGPCIYLARRPSRHRRLSNAGDVERAAGDLGFEIVYPEDLTFTEQAALVQDARCVVAPEGSAIYLAMFARPGTTLLVLSHPLTDALADYNFLLEPHGVEMLALTGPITRENRSTPHDSDYRIDVTAFRSLTASLVGRSLQR